MEQHRRRPCVLSTFPGFSVLRASFFSLMSLALMVLLTWSIALVSVRADESKPKTYFIGVEDIAYYPHYISDASGYHGFARDLLDFFAASRGIRFEYVPYPVQRLFDEFLAGEVDFKYPDNPRWQVGLKKNADISYSSVVADYIAGAMVRPDRLGIGIDQLKVLGYVKGFTPLPFMALIKAKRIEPFENLNFAGVLQQTLSGRVDAAYVNLNVAASQMQRMGLNPRALVFDPGLPHSQSAFYLSTIRCPDIIKDFNLFLEEHQDEVTQLKERYEIRLYP